MSEHDKPNEGGSYVREKDGSLRRVEATEPVKTRTDARRQSKRDEAPSPATKRRN